MMELKIIRASTVFLSLCLAFVMAVIFIDIKYLQDGGYDMPGLKKELAEAHRPKLAPLPPAVTPAGFEDLSAIGSGGLFGDEKIILIKKERKPAKVARRAARSTEPKPGSGNIFLKGTIVSDHGNGYAIFEDKRSKRQDVTHIGDEVFGEGKLIGVEKDKVFIVKSGVTTYYTMASAAASVSKSVRPVTSRSKRPNRHGRHPGPGQEILRHDPFSMNMNETAGEESDSYGSIDPNLPALIDRDDLDYSLETAPEMLSYISFEPYGTESGITGFLVGEVDEESLFALLGLKRGDIISALNGLEVAGPYAWYNAIQDFYYLDEISLVVRREGIDEKLSFVVINE